MMVAHPDSGSVGGVLWYLVLWKWDLFDYTVFVLWKVVAL